MIVFQRLRCALNIFCAIILKASHMQWLTCSSIVISKAKQYCATISKDNQNTILGEIGEDYLLSKRKSISSGLAHHFSHNSSPQYIYFSPSVPPYTKSPQLPSTKPLSSKHKHPRIIEMKINHDIMKYARIMCTKWLDKKVAVSRLVWQWR